MTVQFWCIVKGGRVVGSLDAIQDPLNFYDNTYAWFLSSVPLVTSNSEDITSHDSELVTIFSDPNDTSSDTVTVVLPTSKTVKATSWTSTLDPRLAMNLADAKTAVISMLNSILAHEILVAYSVQTQLDTIRVGGGSMTTMGTAIAALETHIAGLVTSVNALGTVAACIAFNVWS